MSHRLDPQSQGASVTLAVRFEARALAVIDGERTRLEELTGEPCDRSRALRSIVRQFGERRASPVSQPLAERPPSAASRAAPSDAATGRDAKPSKGSKRRASTADASPEPGHDAPGLDNATLRARWKRAGLSTRPFCASHGITRSAFVEWEKGRDAKPSTLAKIAAGLDAEGEGV